MTKACCLNALQSLLALSDFSCVMSSHGSVYNLLDLMHSEHELKFASLLLDRGGNWVGSGLIGSGLKWVDP